MGFDKRNDHSEPFDADGARVDHRTCLQLLSADALSHAEPSERTPWSTEVAKRSVKNNSEADLTTLDRSQRRHSSAAMSNALFRSIFTP